MPKLIKNRTEINFIWFGGAMPISQVNNFVDIMVQNPEALIQLWVDSKDTYSVLSKQISTSIGRYNLEKGSRYKNFKPRQTAEIKDVHDSLVPYLAEIKRLKLYPALSDIYRHLILSRPQETGERPIRCFFEADNKLEEHLWTHLENKQVALMHVDELDGEVLFPPAAIRTDFVFLDLESPLGQEVQQNMKIHLDYLFSDPVLSACLMELNSHAANFGTLNRLDLIDTYGWITPAVFWLQFLTENSDNLYGMEDILVSRERSNRAIKFSCFRDPENNWCKHGEHTPSLYAGLVRDVFRAILAARVDKSTKILRSVLNELGAKYKVDGKPQHFSTLKDFIDVANIFLEHQTEHNALIKLKLAIANEFYPAIKGRLILGQ